MSAVKLEVAFWGLLTNANICLADGSYGGFAIFLVLALGTRFGMSRLSEE